MTQEQQTGLGDRDQNQADSQIPPETGIFPPDKGGGSIGGKPDGLTTDQMTILCGGGP